MTPCYDLKQFGQNMKQGSLDKRRLLKIKKNWSKNLVYGKRVTQLKIIELLFVGWSSYFDQTWTSSASIQSPTLLPIWSFLESKFIKKVSTFPWSFTVWLDMSLFINQSGTSSSGIYCEVATSMMNRTVTRLGSFFGPLSLGPFKVFAQL